MTRKLLCALMALLLALLSVSALASAEIPRAGSVFDTDALIKYDSFALDKATGEWSVSDPLFLSIRDCVTMGEIRNSMTAGALVWRFSLSGNALTGTIRPALELFYLANQPIGARAISVLAGGARYDFETYCEKTAIGGYSAERLVAPLNAQTLSLIPAMRESGEATIVVHGTESVYTAEISAGKSYTNAKERLEAASLSCLSLYDEWTRMTGGEYGLWEAGKAEWKAVFGKEARFSVCDPATAGEYDGYLDSETKLLCAGMRGDGLDTLIALLRDASFYAGAAETTYSAKTVAAVARAQAYFGLTPTGSADGALFAALAGGASAQSGAGFQGDSPAQAREEVLSGASVAIDRWWIAGAVRASENEQAVIGRADASNLFAVCEGVIRNADAEELGLGWQLTGTITVDGKYAYTCVIRAESDGGEAFATTLTPLQQARLIVAAEIPEKALLGAQTMELALSLNGETLAFSLNK